MQYLTEAARSTNQLRIEGYSVTSAMADGEFIKSRRWTVGGYDWEIHLRPKDHYAGKHHPVIITLKLVFLGDARTKNTKAKLTCRLIDPSGKLQPSEEKSVSHKFSRPGDFSDGAVLTARSDLEASGYLKDDSFTVQCTITVLKELPDIATIPVKEVHVPPSNLHQHLAELLQKETGADVTFAVSGESFAAHRNVLAARSPVFMAEFFGHMEERSSQCVDIKDMEAAVFKAVLHFIYTDAAPELDRQGEEAMMIAQHLLAAADRYGLGRLKLICENKLSDGINVDTAATTLALAEQHNCSQLKVNCVEFIAGAPENLDAVLETEGYKHLEASCPLVLTDLLKVARGKMELKRT